ncbi:mRNA-decapping enzyme subunit 1, putative (DCP1) [Plasmodium ovale wallikeri]|uniref:mRNA-decapping enzyme subunit 1, putative n=3 Tax=Plasmodium ovale TaxID=36330 RepID=A0A1C3KPX3_PLAOA|nr:mRNA-decapping enzyme subunit 1, putative (DCP1) [Plasmodium ovale wallikeri]SBT76152.1 mRNA-decapping enzyme subunit 1, putative [Plasmodium ovale]
MKKKNNMSTNHGKLKNRVGRYDMNGSYTFSEYKNNNKGIGNNGAGDLSNCKMEDGCGTGGYSAVNANSNNNNPSHGHVNSAGANSYHAHNLKYNKNSYLYDYNAHYPKKNMYEYKDKFKSGVVSSNGKNSSSSGGNCSGNGGATTNNSATENKQNNMASMSTLANVNNKTNKEKDKSKEKEKEKEKEKDTSEGRFKESNKNGIGSGSGVYMNSAGKRKNDEEKLSEEMSLLREKICFKMLKSIDIYITEIIMKSCFVTVYKMKEDELKWTRADIEGFLYIVRRSVKPFYRLIITNKKNENHLLQDINASMNLSTDQNYIFYRIINGENKFKSIFSLWFYSTEEKEKIYNVLKDIVEQACHDRKSISNGVAVGGSHSNVDMDNISTDGVANVSYNKNVNFILSKGGTNVQDLQTGVLHSEEISTERVPTAGVSVIKNTGNRHDKKGMHAERANPIDDNDGSVGKAKGGEDTSNANAQKKGKIKKNSTSAHDHSKEGEIHEGNYEANLAKKHGAGYVNSIVMNGAYGGGGSNGGGNANGALGNYTNGSYLKEAFPHGGYAKKIPTGDGEEVGGGCNGHFKAPNEEKHKQDYNDKAGKNLLYLIKGLSIEHEKEQLDKRYTQDMYYENNIIAGSTHGLHKSFALDEKSNFCAKEMDGKTGGEAIMNLLGLSKNNEQKEEDEERKKKMKKKKNILVDNAGNAVTVGINGSQNNVGGSLDASNIMNKSNMQKREKQLVPSHSRDSINNHNVSRSNESNDSSNHNGNNKMHAYYRSNQNGNDEYTMNKSLHVEGKYSEKQAYQNCSVENAYNREVEMQCNHNMEEKNMTNALLDIIKVKSGRMSAEQFSGEQFGGEQYGGEQFGTTHFKAQHNSVSNGGRHLPSSLLSAYNTDSYDVLLKMQNEIEISEKKKNNNVMSGSCGNVHDDAYAHSQNSYAAMLSNKNKQNGKYDNNAFEKHHNIGDFKNKSITLNRSTIHNVIRETLQSDEFVNLLWEKLVTSKSFH